MGVLVDVLVEEVADEGAAVGVALVDGGEGAGVVEVEDAAEVVGADLGGGDVCQPALAA